MCIGLLFFFFFKQKTAYEIGVRLVGSEMCIKRQIPICTYLPLGVPLSLYAGRCL